MNGSAFGVRTSLLKQMVSSTLASLLIAAAIPAAADDGEGRPLYGKTIGNWGHAWWQWALDFPAATIPLLQNGPVDCSAGQSGKVWFLAGNFGGTSERSCTIKKGRALFFPILNGIAWTPEDCTTELGCRELVSAVLIDGLVNLTCTLDGTPCVFTTEVVRAQSDPRRLNFPPGSIAVTDWGYAPGVREMSIADGYWVMLDPLPPGSHTLRITAERGAFQLDVTYQLVIRN